MANAYHYTESGFDDVYLVNGLKIKDIEGLHRAIGEWLVSTKNSSVVKSDFSGMNWNCRRLRFRRYLA